MSEVVSVIYDVLLIAWGFVGLVFLGEWLIKKWHTKRARDREDA